MTAVDKSSPTPNSSCVTTAATAEENSENDAQTTPNASQMAAIAASVASAASTASTASLAALPDASPLKSRALAFADASASSGRGRRGTDANDRRSDSEARNLQFTRRARSLVAVAVAGACARAGGALGSAPARCPAPPSCSAAIGHAIGSLEVLLLGVAGPSTQMCQYGESCSTWTKELFEQIPEYGWMALAHFLSTPICQGFVFRAKRMSLILNGYLEFVMPQEKKN